MSTETLNITAELSMYPLDAGYEELIIGFIHTLRAQPGVQVLTNQLSTQLTGSFAAVTGALNTAMREHMQGGLPVVFVVKYLNGALEIGQAPVLE